eukprot:6136815-Amphidinium_carterae.1
MQTIAQIRARQRVIPRTFGKGSTTARAHFAALGQELLATFAGSTDSSPPFRGDSWALQHTATSIACGWHVVTDKGMDKLVKSFFRQAIRRWLLPGERGLGWGFHLDQVPDSSKPGGVFRVSVGETVLWDRKDHIAFAVAWCSPESLI